MLVDLARAEEDAVRQHDAPGVAELAAADRRPSAGAGPISSGGSPCAAMWTMRQSRSQQRVDDRAWAVGCHRPRLVERDELIVDAVARARTEPRRDDRARLRARAGERRVVLRGRMRGSPITSTLASAPASRACRGTSSVRSLRSSLARIAQGRRVAAAARCRVSSSSHGNRRRCRCRARAACRCVPPRNGSSSTGTSSWNSVRPICGSWLRSSRGARDQLAQQRPCVGLRADLGARALRVERVGDRGLAVRRSFRVAARMKS